jgi:hypothetical protein
VARHGVTRANEHRTGGDQFWQRHLWQGPRQIAKRFRHIISFRWRFNERLEYAGVHPGKQF